MYYESTSPHSPYQDDTALSTTMAAYGVPPALGVAPEMMEEISTGVRRCHAVHARAIWPCSKAPIKTRFD
jgi:hypothetical protein